MVMSGLVYFNPFARYLIPSLPPRSCLVLCIWGALRGPNRPAAPVICPSNLIERGSRRQETGNTRFFARRRGEDVSGTSEPLSRLGGSAIRPRCRRRRRARSPPRMPRRTSPWVSAPTPCSLCKKAHSGWMDHHPYPPPASSLSSSPISQDFQWCSECVHCNSNPARTSDRAVERVKGRWLGGHHPTTAATPPPPPRETSRSYPTPISQDFHGVPRVCMRNSNPGCTSE